jgi:catechol 2,3-dioxygenase-like lactoylglutathione lyase family enzyme
MRIYHGIILRSAIFAGTRRRVLMEGVFGTSKISQLGLVVRDIESAKNEWARFLGLEVPPTVAYGDYSVVQTTYKGEAAPYANCLLAFFDVGDGLQLELIQPNKYPSTWRDFLEHHGEGIHHVAFKVGDTEKIVKTAGALGVPVVQEGKFRSGNGRYTYLEASDKLRCVVELLEAF